MFQCCNNVFARSSSNTEVVSLCKQCVVDLNTSFFQGGLHFLDTSGNIQIDACDLLKMLQLMFHRCTAYSLRRFEEGAKYLGHLQKCSKSLNTSSRAAPGSASMLFCLVSPSLPPSVSLLLIPLLGSLIGRQSLSPILLLSWF